MAILVDRDTRILVQGITGRHGSLHARLMREYGANVVAGVTPGKGGTRVSGVPVYDTVAGACEARQPNASLLLVPPAATPGGRARGGRCRHSLDSDRHRARPRPRRGPPSRQRPRARSGPGGTQYHRGDQSGKEQGGYHAGRPLPGGKHRRHIPVPAPWPTRWPSPWPRAA